MTTPRIAVVGVGDQIGSQLVSSARGQSVLRADVEISGNSQLIRPGASAQDWRRKTIEQEVVVAFKKLYAFWSEQYFPNTGNPFPFPNFRTEERGTNTRSGKKQHWIFLRRGSNEIGLSEVERIRREMDRVILDSGFSGSFEDFVHFLRTDPQFYFTRPEDLLSGYRDICKRADAELPRFFGNLPRLPYGCARDSCVFSAFANDGLLRDRFARGRPARLVLRKHLQAGHSPEVGNGTSVASRSCSRPSPAAGARTGAS